MGGQARAEVCLPHGKEGGEVGLHPVGAEADQPVHQQVARLLRWDRVDSHGTEGGRWLGRG